MHTCPPMLVVASPEELVHLATAQLEEDQVKGRVVLECRRACHGLLNVRKQQPCRAARGSHEPTASGQEAT